MLDLDLPVDEWAKEEGIADEEVRDAHRRKRADEHMAAKVAQWGPDVMRYVEKSILLQTLDHLWREHLVMLEHLRQVIGLRGYGQRDPLNEYKSEAFEPVRGDDRESARGGDRAVDAGRDRAGAAGRAAASSFPTWKRTRSIRSPARTRWRSPTRRCRRHGRRGNASQRAIERNPNDPATLGQGRPQRGLPVRLRQEIQALPRRVRLSRLQAFAAIKNARLCRAFFVRDAAGRLPELRPQRLSKLDGAGIGCAPLIRLTGARGGRGAGAAVRMRTSDRSGGSRPALRGAVGASFWSARRRKSDHARNLGRSRLLAAVLRRWSLPLPRASASAR